MGTQVTTRDGIAGWFADRQHGVVSYAQLIGAGLTARVIRRAVQAGRLRPLFRGVCAVGHRALRREGWWTAALLACGEDSVLSQHSAAQLWDLRRGEIRPIHVTSTAQRGRTLDGIVAHRVAELPKAMRVDGVRVTTPAQAIADLAATLRGRELRKLVERAQDLRRFHSQEIRAAAGDRRGAKQLRNLLDLLEPDDNGARSHLERLFLVVVRQARLPKPQVNAVVAGRRRDFFWPALNLVVEVDGYAYHSTKQAFTRDRRRDRELTVLGMRPVRFTYEEVAFEPERVGGELAALL